MKRKNVDHIGIQCNALSANVTNERSMVYVYGVPAHVPTSDHDLRVFVIGMAKRVPGPYGVPVLTFEDKVLQVEERKRGTYKSHRLLRRVLCEER